jgi:aspartyl protease family protein
MDGERNSGPDARFVSKGTFYGAWVLALGLFTLFFNDVLTDSRNPNQKVSSHVSAAGMREVVLRPNRYDHYVATGHINGKPVEFLLDTGATNVAVPAALARQLGLSWGRPTITITAKGFITTYVTVLERIGLGDIVLRDVTANINPNAEGDEVLLGMSFLRQIELIQRGNRLTLRQQAP